MKNKKRGFRFFSYIVICMIMVCSVCPVAFAAPAYTDQGFLVDPVVVDLSFFTLQTKYNGDVWVGSVSLAEEYKVFDTVSSVLVWIGDYSYNCRVTYSDSSDRGDEVCYIGNISLFSKNESDYDVPFSCTFDTLSRSNFELILAPDFYSALLNEYDGYVTFAIQPITETGFAGSVSAGLYNTTHWVGQVISSLISPDGALSGLLPMLAIIVSVPALILGIKVIRSIIWGA